jgi:toxin-antitoxin system PIN domain toxin
MQMPDVNILVYAHREETHGHERYAKWLTALACGAEPFALSEPVLHGFIRVVTNSRIFNPPSTPAQVFQFIDALLERPNCTMIRPGVEHWAIFRQLCERGKLKGKIVADAVHAAVAIESGCEWVTADSDFVRFKPTLRWVHL